MSIHPDAVERTVVLDDAEVVFYDTCSAKTPLVLLHGTGGSVRSHFGRLFAMLAPRYRVIALEFAPAPAGEALSLDWLVRQVNAVLGEATDEPVVLVGYSLGAVVAAAMAAAHPARVKDLVLVAGWMKSDSQQRLRNAVWQRLRQANSPALREFMLYTSYGAPFLAARTEPEIEDMLARVSVDGRDEQMELNRDVDLSSILDKIRARTLVIGCTYDQMVPLHHSHSLLGAIADARLATIDSGHAVIIERPAELFHLIDAFAARRIDAPAGCRLATPTI
ncbi:alpha/beta hydrolase [Kribbella sp. NPDC050820]|uniref:alpha/beta fold hydrolase n=1 Tax=Kribbella sp. NPDC050820 TaxID=3155408 RepID=UPI0033CDAF88